MRTFRERREARRALPLPIGWGVVLLGVMLSLTGCSTHEEMVKALKASSLRQRKLHVLVLPPMNDESRQYAPDAINTAIKELVLEGLKQLNTNAGTYAVECNALDDQPLIQRWYAQLQSSATDIQRRERLVGLMSRYEKATHLLFGRYKKNASDNTVGLMLFLYDKHLNTIAKEPASSFRWISWQSREEVANHLGHMMRDLIARNF